MDDQPERLDTPVTPSPDTNPGRCNVTLPSWPADRACMCGTGHEGDHGDGTRTWTTDDAMKLHGLIADAAVSITTQALALAREAVLRGTVSMQLKGLENRAERRKEAPRGKVRDARKRR